jgi:hypothetical protein
MTTSREANSDAYPVTSFTAEQLRCIAGLIDALDKADPVDSRSGVYPQAVRLTSNDDEDFGTISDPDGTGYFWSPANGDLVALAPGRGA